MDAEGLNNKTRAIINQAWTSQKPQNTPSIVDANSHLQQKQIKESCWKELKLVDSQEINIMQMKQKKGAEKLSVHKTRESPSCNPLR